MRFPSGTIARPSFARTLIYPLRVSGDYLVFAFDPKGEEYKVRVGMSLMFKGANDEVGVPFSQWLQNYELPDFHQFGEVFTNALQFMRPKPAYEELRTKDLQWFKDQPQSEGCKVVLRDYDRYKRSIINATAEMTLCVAEVALAMADHQVSGDDVKKALKARGLNFSGKVIGNYLGGYDISSETGAQLTFEQYLEALSSAGLVGQ